MSRRLRAYVLPAAAISVALSAAVFLAGGCSSDGQADATDNGGGPAVCIDRDNDGYGAGCAKGSDCNDNDPAINAGCQSACNGTPATGCGCSTEGALADCGKVESRFGSRVTCGEGKMTCSHGTWGTCILNNSTPKTITVKPASLTIEGLGPASPCTANPCDPYCQQFPDTPDNTLTDPDGGVVGTPAGIQLPGTALDAGPAWDGSPNGPISPIVSDYLTDAGAMPSGSYFYHELSPGEVSPTDDFDISAVLSYIDVYFLLDTSATMGEALTSLGNAVAGGTGIISQLHTTFPNARFGVGHFHAYQMPPHDTDSPPFDSIPLASGSSHRAVFPLWHSLNQQLTDVAAQDVMLWLGGGGTSANNDATEGQNVALFAVATSDGLWAQDGAGTDYGISYGGNRDNRYWVNPRNAGGSFSWVTDYPGAASGEPVLPAGTSTSGPCPGGSFGYPCFAVGSTPIVVLMSDNPGEQGPGGLFAQGHYAPATETSYSALAPTPGVSVWPAATNVDFANNGVEANSVVINPGAFQRFSGDFAHNGAPVGGSQTAGGEGGFDLSAATNFPTVVPGDTTPGALGCATTLGVGGREAYFKFTIPAGNGQAVHFDTLGSQANLSMYVIDAATRKRMACADQQFNLTPSSTTYPGMNDQPPIEARLGPGNYILVIDEGCPSGYTAASDGHCYRRYSGGSANKDWAGAEAQCVSDGGHLISIESAAADSTLLATLPVSTNSGQWIGLEAPINSSTYSWSDGTPFSYARWLGGTAPVPSQSGCGVRTECSTAGYTVACSDGTCCPTGGTCGSCASIPADGTWTNGNVCPASKPVDCEGACCPAGYTCGGSCGQACCPPTNCTNGAFPTDCGGNLCCPSGMTCGGTCGKACCTPCAATADPVSCGATNPQCCPTAYTCQAKVAGNYPKCGGTGSQKACCSGTLSDNGVAQAGSNGSTYTAGVGSAAYSSSCSTTRSFWCEVVPGANSASHYYLQVGAVDDAAPVAVPSYEQTISSLNGAGAKVIGIDVSGIGPINATGTDFDACDNNAEDKHDKVDRFNFLNMQETARRTGSLDSTDPNYWTNPFVFSMNRKGGPCHAGDPDIGTQVVTAVTKLTQRLRQDVTVEARDTDDANDFDYAGAPGTPAQLTPANLDEGPNTALARPYGVFIDSVTVVPVSGVGNGSADPGPNGQPRCLDDPATTDIIEQCLPDTQVKFQIKFSVPTAVPALTNVQIFNFDVQVRGGGTSTLASKPAVIVIPPVQVTPPTFTTGYFTRDYDTSGVCIPGTVVDWGLWSWTAQTPSDSKIDFFVRTADTAAGLDTAPEDQVQFANPPGPPALAGQGIGVNAANGSEAGSTIINTTLAAHNRSLHLPFLRVRSRLTASTDGLSGPTLAAWNLEVDCQPYE